MEPTIYKLKLLLVGVVSGVIFTVLIGTFFFRGHSDPADSAVVATVAPEISREKPVSVDCDKLNTYPHGKKKLGLPQSVAANHDAHVTAADKIKPSDHSQTVISVTDTKTGDTELYYRTEPLPLLAFDVKRTFYMDGGMNEHGGAVRGGVALEFMQVKAAHVSLIGEGDSSGGHFIGLRASLRF